MNLFEIRNIFTGFSLDHLSYSKVMDIKMSVAYVIFYGKNIYFDLNINKHFNINIIENCKKNPLKCAVNYIFRLNDAVLCCLISDIIIINAGKLYQQLNSYFIYKVNIKWS